MAALLLLSSCRPFHSGSSDRTPRDISAITSLILTTRSRRSVQVGYPQVRIPARTASYCAHKCQNQQAKIQSPCVGLRPCLHSGATYCMASCEHRMNTARSLGADLGFNLPPVDGDYKLVAGASIVKAEVLEASGITAVGLKVDLQLADERVLR